MPCKLENGSFPSEPAERERAHSMSEDSASGETSTIPPGSDLVQPEFNTKENSIDKFQSVLNDKSGHMQGNPSASDGFETFLVRARDEVMTSTTLKLLILLLLASLLGGTAASPLPASVRVQGSGRAEQGQAHSLTCVVEGLPDADTSSSYIYVWYKDGDIIRNETKQVLTFTRLTQGDAGMYQCGPKRSPRLGLMLSQPSQLRVLGMHRVIPRPTLGAWTIPVLHHLFELTCTVFGLPQNHDIHLTYTWFKDSREIPGQTSKSLLFPSLTRGDEGVYVCRARSGHVLTTSPDSNEKNLLILLPPRVHMEPATADNVIRRAAGEELTLTCKVTEAFPGVTADGYSWSYLPSSLGQLQPLGGRDSILKLGPLTSEDSGQYFCQARNDLKAFQGLIPPGNSSITVDVVYLENITLTTDPEANEGDHVTLTCGVDSNQAVRLAWIVDGQEVRHVTANVDNYVLERAACSDSKTYTCRASNPDLPGLERHASTNVRVLCNDNLTGQPSPSPPPSSSTQKEEGRGPLPALSSWQWALLVVMTQLPLAFVTLLSCCKTNLKEKMLDAKASFLRRRPAAEKKQPDQEGQEMKPLQDAEAV